MDPPRFIGSFAVEHPAHQSDLVRLTCLLRDGGVYLDLDVLSVRDLSPLREFSFVIGEEGIDGREGLCNAVMLAEPGSTFVAEWLDGHYPETSRWSGFRARGHDEHWDEMSCKYPAYLAALFPGDIRIERHDSFHWPTWYEEHLEWFFRGKGDQFPNAYCHHLWNFASGDKYLSKLTPEYIRSVDTNFNVLARPNFQD